MSLKETKDIIKKIILPFGSLVLLVFVGVWWFSREAPAEEKFGKLQAPEINSILSSKVRVENFVDIVGSQPIAKVGNVYRKVPILEAKNLAEKLGFSGEPTESNGQLSWTSENEYLTFSKSSGLSFLDSQKLAGGNLQKKDVLPKAKEVLEKVGLIDKNTSLNAGEVGLFWSDKSDVIPVSAEDAFNLYSINLGVNLGGRPLIDKTGSTQLIDVWLFKNGTVKKIESVSQPFKTKDSSTYKIKPLKNAEAELKNGKGIIISLEPAYNYNKVLKPFKKISITYSKVSLAYFLSGWEDPYFQPVYVFTGSGVTQNTEFAVLTTVLPAVAN